MKKKVLVFRSDYLPVSETFISDHLRSLSRYQPLVASEKDSPAKHRIPLSPTLVANTWLTKKLFKHAGWSIAFDRLIKNEQPDIVHAHFLTDAAKIIPMMELNSLPFVVTAHGYDAATYDKELSKFPDGKLLLDRRQRLIRRVSKIICVSAFIRDQLIERGYPAEKLVISHLGVELETLKRRVIRAKEASGIVFVGRLVEKKGARFLIEAYAKLPITIRNRHSLTIIGDGPLRENLKSIAENLDISVNFLGSQPRSVVVEELKQAAAFVLPSIRAENGDAEGMPIAIMEALALGVPVCIFNDQPMAPLMLEKSAGALAAPSDSVDLAKKLLLLLENKDLADAITDAGRLLVEENFDLFSNTILLEEIYDQVVLKHQIKKSAQ